MFQSLKNSYLYPDPKQPGIFNWEVDLIDSDFGTVKLIGCGRHSTVAFSNLVIQEYTKRNLNVAANIALYFQWYQKSFFWSIFRQLEMISTDESSLLTAELKSKLDKYLLLT
jgi:hypothetical protein